MRHTLKNFLNYLLLVVALQYATVLFAEDSSNDESSDDQNTVRIYNDIDLTSVTKFDYAKRTVIKSVFPQLSSQQGDDTIDDFNGTVENIIKDNVAEFKQKVKKNENATSNFISDEAPPTNLNNRLTIDYNSSILKVGSNHIISIRFSLQGYLVGMAHPYHEHDVLNYNTKDHQELELADLFSPNADYLTVISNYARDTLKKHLAIKDMIDDGTLPKPENFAVWNLKPNGILFTFEEYQVAPYVYGAQTVLVPYQVLKDMIPADSVIAPCLRNKNGCSANHLFTGGFLDEAKNTSRAVNPHHRILNPTLSAL